MSTQTVAQNKHLVIRETTKQSKLAKSALRGFGPSRCRVDCMASIRFGWHPACPIVLIPFINRHDVH
ncbi:hypothetical protein RCO48_38345 [Peribacillus frigoritolerans]|nr:hypothetical protein [Peribacillus frigoritolerans]